ncbi:hypothetical protein PR048_033115 [Dryococelus australis]|uniref:Uncharacterized protein n=1 Tax=Dryococelus australis TaxID=614101 RepID=A0ABQ9FZC6_9NEOP|nr:hypothetical protein PR048_033115 [Dryococelus australis]
MAYCVRFFASIRRHMKPPRGLGLTVAELNSSLQLRALVNNKEVPKASPLSSVNPFPDKEGLISIVGHIQKSPLREDQRHPAYLPRRHRVSMLFVQEDHLKLLHAKPQALLYPIQQK